MKGNKWKNKIVIFLKKNYPLLFYLFAPVSTLTASDIHVRKQPHHDFEVQQP